MQYYQKVVMNRYHEPDKNSAFRPKISRTKLLPIDFMPETPVLSRGSHHCLEASSELDLVQYIQPKAGKSSNTKIGGQCKRSKRYMNPFVDARRNIKMMEEFNVKISQDIEKLKKFKHPSQAQNKINMSSLLVLCSETYNSGTLKKVLAVPSLKVYFLEEQPIRQNYDLPTLEENCKRWERAIEGPYKLEIHGHLWNSSEGFVSLMYDYTPSFTISQLLYEFGFLPENIIQQLTKELVSGLVNFQHQGINHYCHLKPEEVKLSIKTGKVQFHPSIQLLSKAEPEDNDQIVNRLMTLQLNGRNPLPEKQTAFRVGYLLFISSVGRFTYDEEILQAITTLLHEYSRLKNNKSFKHEKTVEHEDICCLIHLLDAISGVGSVTIDFHLNLQMYTIRRAKWSDELVDLLCGCLRFNELYRFALQQIKIHHFLVQKDITNKKVDIRDFIKTLQSKSSAEQMNTIVGSNKLNYFCSEIQKVITKNGILPKSLTQNTECNEVISQLTGRSVAVVSKSIQNVYSKFLI